MAKTYIDIVKYMVEAKFEINGLVEKPDIIGAVFGQTEGLLGGNLDLRELQKNGKIGRIEIDQNISNNKTYGKLFLPSSLNRVETCILAAAIESVDRVGPFETEFKVEKVEDTRDEKRKKIIARAKELVKTLISTEIPDSREISDLVETDVKASTITTYGPEAL
ncbi:MAG: DNA primase DnaG, partial [Candidatus Micrarchaeia archaeon]